MKKILGAIALLLLSSLALAQPTYHFKACDGTYPALATPVVGCTPGNNANDGLTESTPKLNAAGLSPTNLPAVLSRGRLGQQLATPCRQEQQFDGCESVHHRGLRSRRKRAADDHFGRLSAVRELHRALQDPVRVSDDELAVGSRGLHRPEHPVPWSA
jgi:hypothetical protein